MFDIVHEMEKPDTMHQFAMFGLVHERNNQKIPVKLAGNHNQEVQCRPSGVSFVEWQTRKSNDKILKIKALPSTLPGPQGLQEFIQYSE